MPMFWAINASLRRVSVTVTDPCSFDEWARAAVQILADSLFAPGFSMLIDCRGARAPTPSFVRSQAAFLRQQADLLGNGHYAILVHPENLEAFGMARMLEMIAENENPSLRVRTFRDIAAAEKWLSAPTEPMSWDPFR
jgi:hypothetical protein